MFPQNQCSFLLIPTSSNQSRNFHSNSYWFCSGLSQWPLTSNQMHQTWRYQSTIQDQARKALQSLNQRSLSHSFIVRSHAENCTHFHINQYKLIICYNISWSCDLSFTNLKFVYTRSFLNVPHAWPQWENYAKSTKGNYLTYKARGRTRKWFFLRAYMGWAFARQPSHS